MTLTAQNMESRDGLISHSIFRDIARMDKEQLTRYTRMVFTDKRDIRFLPAPFWDYWFDMEKHGESDYDGRTPPSPAIFLAGVHDIVGSISRRTFHIGDDGEEQPDFTFRARFRTVLRGILEECSTLEGRPTDEQKQLASFAVEAVGAIQSVESFNAVGASIAKERQGILTPDEYPQELQEDLELLRREQAELLEMSEKLIKAGRFGELKLEY